MYKDSHGTPIALSLAVGLPHSGNFFIGNFLWELKQNPDFASRAFPQ